MKKIVYVSLSLMVLFFACKKDEDDTNPTLSQTFVINSTDASGWEYFSFAKNDTITVADPSTSTEWDLAFQRYRIKTNSGKSGSGQGGAANTYLTGQSGFDDLKLASDTLRFVTDDAVQIAVQGGYSTYVVNPAMYTWFTMEMATMGTQIVPTDNIYVVKTGDGKYAKVWIKSYYSATNASGYVTIQYKYQADGSKNLE
jgi:hypothetical protein